MSNKNKVKAVKFLTIILVIAIFVIATIYFIPVIKNLSTPEGKIAFRDKVQNSGFLGMLSLFGLQVAQIFLFIIPGEPIEIIAGMCYGGFWGTIFIMASSAIISILIFLIISIKN